MNASESAADRRTRQAFADAPLEDPRERFRAHLRRLRGADASAFESAVAAYRELVETPLESDDADPLRCWLDYGRRLAELAPGRTVSIDEQGRSSPADADAAPADAALVLHLPDGRSPAFALAVPAEPTPAQEATLDLLVEGRESLRGAES